MRTSNYIIVEVESAYNNEKQIGDTSLVVNSTIESVEHINRIAKVISAPSFTPLKEGDFIIMHHNICRLRNGVKGVKVESDYFIEGNKYFVPLTEVFMYKRGEDWKALSPYCFVQPIKDKTEKIGSIIVQNSDNNYKGMIARQGIMKYSNPELEQEGITKDSHIAFSEFSEYEFVIDGELYYKMKTSDILGKFK